MYAWERERKGIKTRRDPNKKFDRAEYRKRTQWRNTQHAALRRALKSSATPNWLTEENHATIKSMYKDASDQGLHVDHIVPLKGKNVCGLHVPWNLQLLDPSENLKKNNKFDGGW